MTKPTVIVGVDFGEAFEGEDPSRFAGRKRHISELRTDALGVAGFVQNGVDLFQSVHELVVRVGGRQTQLENEAVNFVQHHTNGQFVLHSVAQRALRLHHHTLHCIDHHHRTVRQTQG
jgi:hypothetical protein